MNAPPASVEETLALLSRGDYVADRPLATALFLALRLKRPLFLEGEAGVGKTEIAKVLAATLGRRLVRLQCYEGLDIASAVYEWNYQRQMLEIRLAEAGGVQDRDQLASDIFTERFLIRRPLLQALEPDVAGPAVLLIDELDRTDEPFEAFLLEVLSDFQITIPELGTIKAAEPPIVIVTSNRTREIHDALKRRCFYHWVDYPNAERERAILHAKAPGTPEALSAQIVAFVQKLRRLDLFKHIFSVRSARSQPNGSSRPLPIAASTWLKSGTVRAAAATWPLGVLGDHHPLGVEDQLVLPGLVLHRLDPHGREAPVAVPGGVVDLDELRGVVPDVLLVHPPDLDAVLLLDLRGQLEHHRHDLVLLVDPDLAHQHVDRLAHVGPFHQADVVGVGPGLADQRLAVVALDQDAALVVHREVHRPDQAVAVALAQARPRRRRAARLAASGSSSTSKKPNSPQRLSWYSFMSRSMCALIRPTSRPSRHGEEVLRLGVLEEGVLLLVEELHPLHHEAVVTQFGSLR